MGTAVRPVAPGRDHVVVLNEERPVTPRITTIHRSVAGPAETDVELALQDADPADDGFHRNVAENADRAARGAHGGDDPRATGVS